MGTNRNHRAAFHLEEMVPQAQDEEPELGAAPFEDGDHHPLPREERSLNLEEIAHMDARDDQDRELENNDAAEDEEPLEAHLLASLINGELISGGLTEAGDQQRGSLAYSDSDQVVPQVLFVAASPREANLINVQIQQRPGESSINALAGRFQAEAAVAIRNESAGERHVNVDDVEVEE